LPKRCHERFNVLLASRRTTQMNFYYILPWVIFFFSLISTNSKCFKFPFGYVGKYTNLFQKI
jgi:hypothetical protein